MEKIALSITVENYEDACKLVEILSKQIQSITINITNVEDKGSITLEKLKEIKKDYVEDLLKKNNYNFSRTAKILQVSRQALGYFCKKNNIKRGKSE